MPGFGAMPAWMRDMMEHCDGQHCMGDAAYTWEMKAEGKSTID